MVSNVLHQSLSQTASRPTEPKLAHCWRRPLLPKDSIKLRRGRDNFKSCQNIGKCWSIARIHCAKLTSSIPPACWVAALAGTQGSASPLELVLVSQPSPIYSYETRRNVPGPHPRAGDDAGEKGVEAVDLAPATSSAGCASNGYPPSVNTSLNCASRAGGSGRLATACPIARHSTASAGNPAANWRR